MNKSTLLIAALIAAAGLYLTACTDTAAQSTTTTDAQKCEVRAAQLSARVDSLTIVIYSLRTQTATAATAPAQAQPRPQQTATADASATICPQTFTPKKGAQAGEAQTVHTGSRGGCYYLNSSGNKTYLPK